MRRQCLIGVVSRWIGSRGRAGCLECQGLFIVLLIEWLEVEQVLAKIASGRMNTRTFTF
jgi:hypothetical protein